MNNTNMNSIPSLKEMNTALEVLKANIKASTEKAAALTVQIEKAQAREISIFQARTESREIMKKYNLSEEDVLSALSLTETKKGEPAKTGLSAIRDYYDKL